MCTAPNLSFCVGQIIHNKTKSTMLSIHKQQNYTVHPRTTESCCLFTNNSHAGHPQTVMLAIHNQQNYAGHPQTTELCWPSANSHAGHPQTVMLAIRK